MLFDGLTQFEKCLLTIIFSLVICASFVIGVEMASTPYQNRYPNEYNWFADHDQRHIPAAMVSPAFINTSCRQPGNIHPPHGENVTQIQWLGGRDSGFVGNLKVVYEEHEMILPTPDVGKCIYLLNATGRIVVYGQDTTSGGWTKIGSGNSSSNSNS